MSLIYPLAPKTGPVGSYFEYLEHFTGSGQFTGNLSVSNSGGSTILSLTYPRMGVLALQTGTALSADQRAAITSGNNAYQIKGSNIKYYLNICLAQSGTNWFDGTTTGAARWGMTNNTALTGVLDSTSGIFFRTINNGNIQFVCRNSASETVSSTGYTLSNGVFNVYEIEIPSDGNSVIAKIDGTTVATITSNIPASAIRLNTSISITRATSAVGTNCALVSDWMYFKATPITPFFITTN